MPYMQRTSLLLPPDLQLQAAALARRRGISLGELIRQALLREAAAEQSGDADTFWTKETTFRSGDGTLSTRHDDELYCAIVPRQTQRVAERASPQL